MDRERDAGAAWRELLWWRLVFGGVVFPPARGLVTLPEGDRIFVGEVPKYEGFG
jgi:hypothetical protein